MEIKRRSFIIGVLAFPMAEQFALAQPLYRSNDEKIHEPEIGKQRIPLDLCNWISDCLDTAFINQLSRIG